MKHWSDCALHNEPAMSKGDCDCGGYEPGGLAQAGPLTLKMKIARKLDRLLGHSQAYDRG